MQLGEILTQKGDYDSGTKHFYRAMKISEETNDNDTKENAKVNFGMANASLKWNSHITGILNQIEGHDDAVSCLTTLDNNYFISGSHNGSIRVWDLRTFKFLNEIKCHNRKYDEGTLSVIHE